jgi:NMD protein affecting ribosome stability and mRNA decay
MERYEESKMMYILDFEADQDGITCKTSTKYLAETLARDIKNITAGKLSIAYELKTQARDGTDVYQNTYLVRLPQYTSDDIIEYEGIFWVVRNITESKIKLESLENREIKNFDRNKVNDRSLKKTDSVVSRDYMFVSADGENATMMGLDNYETFDDLVKRLPIRKEIGENVKGFIYEDKNYYVD